MKKLLLFLIFTMLIAGCNESPSMIPFTELTKQPTFSELVTPSMIYVKSTPTPTYTLTPAITSTPTPKPTKAIPTITSTRTVSPAAHLVINCLDIAQQLPDSASYPGWLILTQPSLMGSNYIVDMITGRQSRFPQERNEYTFNFQISPNRKWMAYRRWTLDRFNNIFTHPKKYEGESVINDILIVAGIDGNPQITIPFHQDKWGQFHWLDNQRLIIRTTWEEERETWVETIILNPFTGQSNEPQLKGNYLSRYVLDGLLPWEMPIIYNSSLDRVIYSSQSDDFRFSLVLWDNKKEQVLVNTLTDVTSTYEGPKWSPDESQFVYIMSEPRLMDDPFRQELFLSSREGVISQLTHLLEYYEQVFIGAYSWSPDGRHIAFWFTDPSTNKLEADKLAVVDTITGGTTNYCVPGDSYQAGSPPPLWSPNSNALVVERRIDQHTYQTILVDLEKRYAVQLAEKLIPGGWMISEP